MADPVSNIKHQDYLDHTLSFEWTLKGNCMNWRQMELRTLDLYDKRQCILEIQYQEHSNNNNTPYNVTVNLKLIGNFHFKPSKKIRVWIYFKEHTDTKWGFNLTKVDSKTFSKQQLVALGTNILSRSSINTIFEINCREYTSSVLIEHFTLLLNSEKYSDLTIDARDKNFKVHKNIVSRRNSILAKMIEVDMVEKQTNKITLNNWQPEIVELFLMFVYTGTCEVGNNYVELFQLAHFLRQSDLEKIVEKHMKLSIKMDNFVLLFEIADLYELKDLYKAVENFFRVLIKPNALKIHRLNPIFTSRSKCQT